MKLHYQDLLQRHSAFSDVSVHTAISWRLEVTYSMPCFPTICWKLQADRFSIRKDLRCSQAYLLYGMTEVKGVNIAELFKAAAKYNMSVLQRDCEILLCQNIDMDSVAGLMHLTHLYHAPMLKNSVIAFIQGCSSNAI